jgi:hypothetical protein
MQMFPVCLASNIRASLRNFTTNILDLNATEFLFILCTPSVNSRFLSVAPNTHSGSMSLHTNSTWQNSTLPIYTDLQQSPHLSSRLQPTIRPTKPTNPPTYQLTTRTNWLSSSLSWDTTLCSSVSAATFWRNILPLSSRSRNKQTRKQHEVGREYGSNYLHFDT